jgi:hypothetical protein
MVSFNYLSDAPQALPQAAGFSSGLSPAPQAVPQAAGFSSGLSPAPQDVPQAAGASYVFLFHPNKFESAMFKSSLFFIIFIQRAFLAPCDFYYTHIFSSNKYAQKSNLCSSASMTPPRLHCMNPRQ